MKAIILYLFALLIAGAAVALWLDGSRLALSNPGKFLLFASALAGLCGGLVNCLRAVYLNACVRKNWDKAWHIWYVIRPILSTVMGAIAYVFIRAGLFIFGGRGEIGEWSVYGYLVVSFIAGYNVQRFLERLEALSEAAFGVKPKSTPQNVDQSVK